MNLKEYAQGNGITLEEAKKQTGLTHWKQEVTSVATESAQVVEDVEQAVSLKVVDLASKEEMIGSIKGLGTKSKFWNRRKELGL